MSKVTASSLSKANLRASHLRQASGSDYTFRPETPSQSGMGAVVDLIDKIDYSKNIKPPFRQICSVWIHDESFSTDDILVNTSQIKTNNIKAGDFVQIAPLKKSAKHALDNNEYQGKSKDEAKKRESSDERKSASSFSATLPSDHIVDFARRHIFALKETNPNQNKKQPSLQVCHTTIGFLDFF